MDTSFYKLRVLRSPEEGTESAWKGTQEEGLLESAAPECEGGVGIRGPRLKQASASQAKGATCLVSNTQLQRHKESKTVRTTRDKEGWRRQAVGCEAMEGGGPGLDAERRRMRPLSRR